MTTALAAQLAQIRTKSSHPLDLKAQKKAHSKSLLFEGKIAAVQDFDTVYQICLEGFEELCRLDQRYRKYAYNLFSEQSKQEDRTLLTKAQNKQLDGALDDFLALSSSKILLQPTLKAIEWLVRRFRVHEHNVEAFVLAFLPYHDTDVFATMLSILPETVPSSLKFLRPYMQSLARPPRHAIAYAASNNRSFFGALNASLLKCCQSGYHNSSLISNWAGLVLEALIARCNQSRGPNLEARKQNQEEVTRLILQVANDALSIDGVPQLRTAVYMILTVLASKANLNDEVLKALMLAVVLKWQETSQAGLICIGALVDEMNIAKLPTRVTKALIAIDGFSDDLSTIGTKYRIEKLVLGLVSGLLNRVKKARDNREIHLLRKLFDAELLNKNLKVVAFTRLIALANEDTLGSNSHFDVEDSLAHLISHLAGSMSLDSRLRDDLYKAAALLRHTEEPLLITAEGNGKDTGIEHDRTVDNHSISAGFADFETLTSGLSTITMGDISFLSHPNSEVFESLEQVFSQLSRSSADVSRFSALPVLRKSRAMEEPLFLTFYARVWCGISPAPVRAAAIQAVTAYLKEEELVADPQLLLPYILYGLADTSSHVRKAISELILQLHPFYSGVGTTMDEALAPVLGKDGLNSRNDSSKDMTWLSSKVVGQLLTDIIVPGLEECLLDCEYAKDLLADSLECSKHGRKNSTVTRELRRPTKAAIFACLADHVFYTPLYAVKLRLLRMLNKVRKIGSTSRAQLLLPVLSSIAGKEEPGLSTACEMEAIDYSEFMNAVVNILQPNDHESMQTLQSIVNGSLVNIQQGLLQKGLNYLLEIWSSLKPDWQTAFATSLFQVCIREQRGNGQSYSHAPEALETLTSLSLPSNALVALLDDLPLVSERLDNGSRGAKKRRLEGREIMITSPVSQDQLAGKIRKITVALELVDQSQVQCDTQLLRALFHTFSNLKNVQDDIGDGIAYLQALALGRMLAIMKQAEDLGEHSIDPSSIQTDVLLACIKTSSSPQVRNTGLLLLSSLAQIMPQQVLHNVMPIFTFMGSDILRQGDEYSVHVVQQTMDSIVPRLVQSLHQRKGELGGISELLLSFAAAFEHVPLQRRLNIYTSLVNRIGPDSYLFAFVAILLNGHPRNQRALSFAIEITSSYSVQIQLRSIGQYLSLLLDILKTKPTFSAQILSFKPNQDRSAIASSLLPFLLTLLSARSLINQTRSVLTRDSSDIVEIQELYEHALGEGFLLSELLQGQDSESVICLQILDSLLGLLPMSKLFEAFESLLARSSDITRKQILQSFEHRMDDKKGLQTAQESCLRFLPRLLATIEETSDSVLARSSINAVEKIIDVLGKRDIDAVSHCVRAITSDRCVRSEDPNVRVASLLCVSTFLEAAGETLVPFLPVTVSAGLDSLEESMATDVENRTLHDAAYSLFAALLLYVPWMVSGQSFERLLSLSHESADSDLGKKCDETREGLMDLIAKRVDAKVLSEAVKRTWVSAMERGPQAVAEHMKLLRQAIQRHRKSLILNQADVLGDIFLNAFDLRRIQCSPRTEESYTDAEITDSESAINEAAIAMVYKLNDATFRPLFTRACEWAFEALPATSVKGKIFRKITWYTFLLQLFDTLKSIVTSYASFVIEDAAQVLQDVDVKDDDGRHLWQRVIRVLHATFEHDQDEFYQSPSHFNPTSSALLSQIARANVVDIQAVVIPAIVGLAVATDSSTHYRDINAAILQHMRSRQTKVRLAGVQCQLALTNRLGEEWLALLPEMLPLISELQEDDDEIVEKETLRWIQRIEETIGESLNPMLQ